MPIRLEEVPILKEAFERGEQLGKAEGIVEGKREGIAKGKAEGKVEGAAFMLECLLEMRFGALPASVRSRIESANLGQLQLWLLRSQSQTLEQVFRD